MCERPLITEFRRLLADVEDLKEKLEIVENELDIYFVRDAGTGDWVAAKRRKDDAK